MSRLYLICFLFLFFTIGIRADAQITHSSNLIFIELLGAGDTYSLNYEYLFSQQQSIRAGVGYFPGDWKTEGVNDKVYITTPLTYQYIFGGNIHKLEVLGGFLGTWTKNNSLPDQYKITPQLGVGYRLQPAKHIFLRCGIHYFIPIFLNIDKDNTFLYSGKSHYLWPGISAGWQF